VKLLSYKPLKPADPQNSNPQEEEKNKKKAARYLQSRFRYAGGRKLR